MNFAYSISIPERILNSIVTKIKTVELDGIKFYELSSLCNTNFIYDQNATRLSVYIDKDTGLPVKLIEEIKKDNVVKENITTTDEDIIEPDISQYTYTVQENN